MEREFEFSEWPGRFGIPLIASLLLFGTVITAVATAVNPSLGALAWMLTYVLGQRIWLSRRKMATSELRWRRSRSTNLEAVRGDKPRLWLVAHLDSKSQTIPMLLRVASHIALVVVAFGTFLCVFLAQWGALHTWHWWWIALAGLIAALPSLFCLVGNRSPGALDNATGVAAVLLAAKLIPREKAIGVLITSGEELDLAGAREWAKESHPGVRVINCDTVDDEGGWRCMFQLQPHALTVAAEKAAKKLGLALRMGKVIPGILTDSIALEQAGIQSVTISRGTLRTLARLHTSGDQPSRVSGSGAAQAARILALMAEELS